jgi:hypothetical protein
VSSKITCSLKVRSAAAGASPGRAQRAAGKPGQVAATPYDRRRENGRAPKAESVEDAALLGGLHSQERSLGDQLSLDGSKGRAKHHSRAPSLGSNDSVYESRTSAGFSSPMRHFRPLKNSATYTFRVSCSYRGSSPCRRATHFVSASYKEFLASLYRFCTKALSCKLLTY